MKKIQPRKTSKRTPGAPAATASEAPTPVVAEPNEAADPVEISPQNRAIIALASLIEKVQRGEVQDVAVCFTLTGGNMGSNVLLIDGDAGRLLGASTWLQSDILRRFTVTRG